MMKKRHSFQKLYIFSRNGEFHHLYLLRPFIQSSRFEILKFCEFWTLPVYPDLTNFQYFSIRNRLRSHFFPYMKIFMNLNFFKNIDQFLFLNSLNDQYFQSIFLNQKAKNFLYFPKVLQYSIFQNFFNRIQKKISFKEILSLIN